MSVCRIRVLRQITAEQGVCFARLALLEKRAGFGESGVERDRIMSGSWRWWLKGFDGLRRCGAVAGDWEQKREQ
jgi:hypothetical protein